MKRVVHLTTVHHPYDPRIYHKECKSLIKAGYDVTLIAKQAVIKDQSVKHIPLKSYKSRFNRMILGSLEVYRKAKDINADVYHFHDPELMLVGWLLKKKNNKVIYDIHEDYLTSILQKDYLNPIVRKVVSIAYKLMEKYFTKDMDLCLAEKYYKDMYPKGTCVLNYPTINEAILKHDRSEKPLENALIYTGNVTEVRGAHIHAKIPQIDPSVTVHFIGKCSSNLAGKMKQIAGEYQDRLEITGIDQFVEKEDIEKKYLSRNWLAGLALSPPTEHYMKKELTKFFEYMNAGIPIICSNFPVWKKFIETYKCGLAVDPYNESEVKDAIEYLRNNQNEAKQMGENGKQAVLKELNWNSQEEILIRWYKELLDESNPLQRGMVE